MKQLNLELEREVFPGCEIVLSFSFKTIDTRGNCAHLSANPAISRGQSTRLLKNNDCFELPIAT